MNDQIHSATRVRETEARAESHELLYRSRSESTWLAVLTHPVQDWQTTPGTRFGHAVSDRNSVGSTSGPRMVIRGTDTSGTEPGIGTYDGRDCKMMSASWRR